MGPCYLICDLDSTRRIHILFGRQNRRLLSILTHRSWRRGRRPDPRLRKIYGRSFTAGVGQLVFVEGTQTPPQHRSYFIGGCAAPSVSFAGGAALRAGASILRRPPPPL